MTKNVFDVLKERGFIDSVTDEENLKDVLEKEKIKFYIGFDATADSLTLGHFLQIRVMQHMQKQGHIPVALLGGGTTSIGDPSGKNDMRKLMDRQTIDHNAKCFKEQISRFVDFSDGKGMILNNGDWLLNLNFLEFMRTIGVHFSVNRMLTFDCYKNRMEKGLTFFEFSYMLMQSYDFLHLYRNYGVKLELGGSDQWSNIIGGYELVRKLEEEKVFGMTFKLLITANGVKMGKTEKGAIWLSKEKTSPYEMFQYLRNTDDRDVIKFLKLLTLLDIDEIKEYEKLEGQELNKAKEVLAYEVVKDVHGEEEAKKALEASKAMFGGQKTAENIPSTLMNKESLQEGIGILNILTEIGFSKTNSEARRLINQGGISINDEKITDPALIITLDKFKDDEIILRKGKKLYHKINLKWGDYMDKHLVLEYFEKFAKIPRGSGNEKEISDYLVKLAQEKGYKAEQDKVLNVKIDVPAKENCQNKKRVILQAHMDMVCEKSSDSNHDFLKDPIKLIYDGDILRADGTTLGADDGIGLATAFALAETTEHGPMTILVTVSEETDMHGAKNVSAEFLQGSYLINIDSEDEGILTMAAAGGEQYKAIFTPSYEDYDKDVLSLEFAGLEGGHSGVEIDKNRGNMIKIIAEFIDKVNGKIAEIDCGTKDNAIPRQGKLLISCDTDIAKKVINELVDKYQDLDGDFSITVSTEKYKGKIQTEKSSKEFAKFLLGLPTGLRSYTDYTKKFLESSSNLAIVRRYEKDTSRYLVKDSMRFIKSSLIEEFEQIFKDASKGFNVDYEFINYYPEWEYKEHSPLREIVKKTYKESYGKDMELAIIHGGLECGVFYKKNPNLDIVSLGPDVRGAHTPKETTYLGSIQRVYNHLVKVINELD